MSDITKRLGYGGSADIAGVQVLITSGSLDTSLNVSYLEPLDLPPSTTRRSRIKHADGTAAYNGSLSFDVTEPFLDVLTVFTLLQRFYEFDIGINDGDDSYAMSACKLTSLSLSGSPGGLITASISFSSIYSRSSSPILNDYILDSANIPLGYWWSGNTAVRDWSFSMNQPVTPMYRNENLTTPSYLKVGLVIYSLAATTYTDISSSLINIATKSFTLTGDTTSNAYSYGGQTDLGTFSHTFETAAVASAGSDGIIIV